MIKTFSTYLLFSRWGFVENPKALSYNLKGEKGDGNRMGGPPRTSHHLMPRLSRLGLSLLRFQVFYDLVVM